MPAARIGLDHRRTAPPPLDTGRISVLGLAGRAPRRACAAWRPPDVPSVSPAGRRARPGGDAAAVAFGWLRLKTIPASGCQPKIVGAAERQAIALARRHSLARGWSVQHEVNGNSEGLSRRNRTVDGRTILRQISLPVVRVVHAAHRCGPYADRLGGTLATIPRAGMTTLAPRSLTRNGPDCGEIGLRDFIGKDDLHQGHDLSADGILEAHRFSRGLPCGVDHVPDPNRRMDFLLDGAVGSLVERNAGTGFTTLPTGFTAAATAAQNHAWRVRQPTSGLAVDILPGFADFRIAHGSAQVPVTADDRNTAFARPGRAGEDIGWTVRPHLQVPDGNGEVLTDPVFGYEGYMPHLATEGQALGHSTGVRLVTSGAGTPAGPPPRAANLVVRARPADETLELRPGQHRSRCDRSAARPGLWPTTCRSQRSSPSSSAGSASDKHDAAERSAGTLCLELRDEDPPAARSRHLRACRTSDPSRSSRPAIAP